MKGKLSARYLTDENYPEWNRLVAASPQGSIYSTPEYLDILCSTAGGRFNILGVTQGDELVGGVALYITSTTFGTSISNRLLLYYNSIVLKEYHTRYPGQRTARHLEILSPIEEHLARGNYARLRLHNRHTLHDVRLFQSRGWIVRPGFSYVVSIEDLDALWQRVDKNFHRLIRRCEQHGIRVVSDDDFDSFYLLHRQTHLRKASPLYLPHEEFRTYFERLSELKLCRLYQARMPDGKAVASQLVLLGDHPVSHSVCAGADPEFMNHGTTPYLRWKAFEDLSKSGFAANDLTDAELNPVTRFKSQLGGDLVMNMVVSRPDRSLFTIGLKVKRFVDRGRSFIGRRLHKKE